jgi:hypothetical protein
MKTVYIEESGMKFGPYPEDECFYIEKSQTYKRIQQNVKMAEFLLLRSRKRSQQLWIVEAKLTAPNLEKSVPNSDKQPNDFDKFIKEVHEKLSNALSLWLALYLKRHPNENLPQVFQELHLANVEFRLILVVKKHQEDWLPPLQDALQKSLKKPLHVTRLIWGLSTMKVIVMNDKLAQDKKLITTE